MSVVVTVDDVRAAAKTVSGVVRRTPLLDAGHVAEGLTLKAELFQHTGSFKVRGVSNRLSALAADERVRGVIGVSAGNHASAVAWGAQRFGTTALVVMWASASAYKQALARSFGAEIDVSADGPTNAFARLEALIAETGRVLVHPFDDPVVIAGQGTVGLEILEDAPDTDVIIVPAGGGGLVSGIAAAVSGSGVRVVAVEPEGSAALGLALEKGEPVPLAPATRIGGLDAPFAGENVLATCRAYGVETVRVSDAAIEEATRELYSGTKLACEPAGAAGLAALREGLVAGDRPALVVSGGNVAADLASAILAGR